MRIAVLGGGRSSEHDVSIASAASVADAIDPSLHEVIRVTVTMLRRCMENLVEDA